MKRLNKNFSIYLLLCAAVFLLLIFPNATGAKDGNMLAVFEIDEFAQYPHLLRMLTVGNSFYQTIRNFVIYLHYFYGYPFYFFSALAGLPLRLILGGDWITHTQLIVTVLRQLVTVLPMLASIGLWLSMSNAFRSTIKTIIGFFILISIPAVFENFFWWHPDSLAFLFVSLTFFFLKKDDLHFKKYFWFAAAAAGLAMGTKHLGEFFILTIPLYLTYAVMKRKISIKQVPLLATGFVVVMVSAVIISNPLLLLPIERGEIIRYQIMQFQETTQGSLVAHQKMSFPQFLQFFNQYGASIVTLLVGMYTFYLGIRQEKTRLFSLLLLSFLLPYGLIIFGGSSLRPNYLIPFFVPFYASLLLLIPDHFSSRWKTNQAGNLLTIILFVQFILFFPANLEQYQTTLTRETQSPSIQFYTKLAEKIPPQTKSIAHDWQIYLPENSHYQVYFDWNNLSYPVIETYQPDLILLEQSRIVLFSGKDETAQLSEYVDGSDWFEFYQDAELETIRGYELLFSDQFGKAFIREGLAN